LDVWSQSILEPIHTHVFRILKQIPNDGCFDQEAPLRRLMSKGLKNLYSFDLSAATDRLPIDLQVQVLTLLYNQNIAHAWKTILIDRPYYISSNDLARYPCDIVVDSNDRTDDKGFNLRYSVGQPMGALSS